MHPSISRAVPSARAFWRVLGSVSIRDIEREAQRSVCVAVVGPPESRAALLRQLFPDAPPESVQPLVRTFQSATAEDGCPTAPGSFDLILDSGAAPHHGPQGGPLYRIDQDGELDGAVGRFLADHPELSLAMARRFPGLRDRVARGIVRETATANAEFAMLNALPGVIPALAILLPAGAVGDMLVLAKNQAMMLLRLAAIYGLPLDLASRARDLAPLAGSAFGWRAIAREVVGFVPGGVGLAAKGAIAYAGTMALGEGLRALYALGQHPTRPQIAALFQTALGEARHRTHDIARRVASLRRALPSTRRKG